MQVMVSGRQVEVTPVIRDYVDGEVKALVDKRAVKASSARVMIDGGKDSVEVSITVNASPKDFVVSASDADFRRAFAMAMDKMDAQMDKALGKMHEYREKPLREQEPQEEIDLKD